MLGLGLELGLGFELGVCISIEGKVRVRCIYIT